MPPNPLPFRVIRKIGLAVDMKINPSLSYNKKDKGLYIKKRQASVNIAYANLLHLLRLCTSSQESQDTLFLILDLISVSSSDLIKM